jgi:chromosome segregation ATPase
MIKWKRIPTFLFTSACLLTLIGCDDIEKQKALAEADQAKVQVAKLQDTLDKTQSEKDNFKVEVTKLSESLREAEAKLAEAVQARDNLKGQIREITTSRDNLQQQVNKLTMLRDELQKKADTLTEERDGLQKRVTELIGFWVTAVTDARDAKAGIQKLTAQLQRHVTDIAGLNNRITTLQLSFMQLKERLEQMTASSISQL